MLNKMKKLVSNDRSNRKLYGDEMRMALHKFSIHGITLHNVQKNKFCEQEMNRCTSIIRLIKKFKTIYHIIAIISY